MSNGRDAGLGGADPVDGNLEGAVLYLVLKELGCELAGATFDERMLMQKAIYIAQRQGVDLGYSYRWHLRGPYSSDLSQTYLRVRGETAQVAELAKGLRLKDEAKGHLQRMRTVLGSSLEHPDELEAIASAMYLDSSDLPKLRGLKPHIDDATWRMAFSKVEELKRLSS